MLDPQTVNIAGRDYTVTKFPATVGREILLQYPTSAIPKLGDYKTNHALMLRIMSYVGVVVEGRDAPLMLTTEALVNNHVPDAETLIRLEWAMITHNFDFFTDGRASGILELLMNKAQGLTFKTLTQFAQRSSAKE